MKYIILSERSSARLSESVGAYTASGYKPHGGLCVVASTNGTTTFYQAVVWNV